MEDPRIKPCWVIIDTCTPQSQLGLSAELRNAIHQKNMLTSRTRKKILIDLDEINADNVEKDRRKRRKRAAEEILTSEVSYLNQLELIKEYFMKPIKERGILTNDEFHTLFGNIHTIYNISNELLRELRKDQENVAGAFSKMAPFFKLYSVYAYDYKKSLNILQQAPKVNHSFSQFLEQQESRPEVQHKLSALLITPIQRVPRYRLLLKQVLDYTSPSHASYSEIIDSLKKVEKAAAHINSLVEEQENTQRLLELQRSLEKGNPSIIKPDRKLIKEGTLMKMSQSGGHNQKRYFVLFNDILMYCKLKKDNPNLANSLKCSCILPLNKCKVKENLSKGAFKITCQDETIALYHAHANEVREWVAALNEAIKKCVQNRRTLRKDSSSRRPVHKKHLCEYQDLGISPGKPRKKRLLENEGPEDIFQNTPDDSEDSDAEAPSCFPIKVNKRKPIRECGHDWPVPSKIPRYGNPAAQDSLFPLREHILQRATAANVTAQRESQETNAAESQMDVVPEPRRNDGVFVFGEDNPTEPGFRFSIGTFFTSLGNTFRRAFNFGQNTL